MPTIDRSVTTYTRRKRAELLTTFSKWNPNKRVEGPRSQSNIPYTEMKLATGFTSFDSEPVTQYLTIADIASIIDIDANHWSLDNDTTIGETQVLTLTTSQNLFLIGKTLTNNGLIVLQSNETFQPVIAIDTTSTFINTGTISNYGVISNIGVFININGGLVTNIDNGVIDNNGTIYSPTTDTGCGIGTIVGTITGAQSEDSCPPSGPV
jgi:hypothetical protein